MRIPDGRWQRDTREQGERRNALRREVLSEAAMACGDRVSESLLSSVDRPALRAAVREFAQHVREKGVPPERALVAFKAMLFTIPARHFRGSEERLGMVAELTRMSIEEYYAE